MQLVKNVLDIFFRRLLPQKVWNYFSVRTREMKSMIDKSKVLSIAKIILFDVVLYPIKLAFALIVFILKSVLLFCTTSRYYRMLRKFWGSFKYAVNEFRQDYAARGYRFALAWKRFCLLMELFTKGREVVRSYGRENPDKTFFVIRPYYFSKPNECIAAIPHLLTNYYSTIQLYEYALCNNWIPVVDWEHYRVPHSEDVPVNGTMNAWEYYWQQPSPHTLEEVYRSKHVILSNMNIPSGGSLPPLRTPKTNIADYARRIIVTGSAYAAQLPFNSYTQKYIDEAKARLFPKGKKILGTAIRGTSYAKMEMGHHAAQPKVEELVELLREKKEEWGADYIFFTNEEEETVEAMKEAFGDTLICLPRKRYRGYHIYSDNSPNPTDEDLNPLYVAGQRSQTNLDYITEMALLSQCDFLLCALSNGIKSVLMWNGGNFERVQILDKGTYLEAWEK